MADDDLAALTARVEALERHHNAVAPLLEYLPVLQRFLNSPAGRIAIARLTKSKT